METEEARLTNQADNSGDQPSTTEPESEQKQEERSSKTRRASKSDTSGDQPSTTEPESDAVGILLTSPHFAGRAPEIATWFAVPVGGPYAEADAATREQVVALQEQLHCACLPVYVGQQRGSGLKAQGVLTDAQGAADGAEAVRLMLSFGFAEGAPVALSVAETTFAERPIECAHYVNRWSATVRGAGFTPIVASTQECLNAVDQDHGWLVQWIGNEPPSDVSIYRLHEAHHAHGVAFGRATAAEF